VLPAAAAVAATLAVAVVVVVRDVAGGVDFFLAVHDVDASDG
jgi:hypothetical protein